MGGLAFSAVTRNPNRKNFFDLDFYHAIYFCVYLAFLMGFDFQLPYKGDTIVLGSM